MPYRLEHRLLGLYLLIYAWRTNADCIQISSDVLKEHLDVSALRTSRIYELKEDIKDLFPVTLGSTNATTFYFSRLSLPTSDHPRPPQVIKKLPNQIDLAKKITLIASGLDDPTIGKQPVSSRKKALRKKAPLRKKVVRR